MSRAKSKNAEIEYRRDGDPAAPAFLLCMGAGEQLIFWPQTLISALVAAGFQVLRFDYRDTGHSTWFDAAGAVDLVGLVGKLQTGELASVPYSLSDMADDAVSVMDAADVAKAHVMGVSLGGMVAQTIAIDHPERVLSLTSVASTTGDRHLPPPNPRTVMMMYAAAPGAAIETWIDARIAAMTAMQGSRYRASPEEIRAAAEASVKRGLNPAGVTRQIAATIVAPPRGDALEAFASPSLVIHGSDDDVISAACGEFTADRLPASSYVQIEGMGHGFSEELAAIWAAHMIELTASANR
jgi:pimeloyl-ACP methyl ester carboxylesterase